MDFRANHFVPDEQVGGWLDDQEAFAIHLMGRECAALGKDAVELGTYEGRSAIHFCNAAQGKAHLTCVDSWAYPEGCGLRRDTFENVFQPNLAAYIGKRPGLSWIRSDTADAATTFADASIWAVFVDAGHFRWEIQRDFEAWYPKVESGGLLLFHDYGSDLWRDVAPYVNEQIAAKLIHPIARCSTIVVARKP